MKDTINISIHDQTHFNPHSLYVIDVDGRELWVDQRCIDRIHDLVEGKWDVEFDGGMIVAYGSYPRSKPPHVCACGKRIPSTTFFCNECFEKLMRVNA